MEVYSSSENLEVQGRACEYKRTFGHEAIRSQLFEHMPALDESTYTRRATLRACPPWLCIRPGTHEGHGVSRPLDHAEDASAG